MRYPRAILAAIVLLASAPATHAALDVRVEFYDQRGTLLDEGTIVHGLAGAVPGFHFVHSWLVPVDEGTHLPVGEAQLQFLEVRLPLARIGVRLHGALAANEELDRVVFGFFQTARDGTVEEFYRVTIHDVQIESLRTELLNNQYPEQQPIPVTQVVRLYYRVVEMEGGDGIVVERLRYLQGDINDDLVLDISDAVRLLIHLFQGVPISCQASGDVNGDSGLDISDVIHLLNYLFRNGPPVPSAGSCQEVPPGTPCEASACSPAQ